VAGELGGEDDRKSEKREPEDWGGASGRPPHTSVSLHLVSDGRPPAPPAPANRQLMRRRTQDTLVAVAPAQSALSGGFSPRASPGLGAAAKREQWAGGGGGSHNGASAGSQESTTGQFLAVPGPGQEAMVASGPERRKMGGSYSRYTGGGKSPVAGGMVLVTDGELCDSSGRVIKTTVTPVSPPVAGMGRAAGTPVPQRL